jgi:hypothetical protein
MKAFDTAGHSGGQVIVRGSIIPEQPGMTKDQVIQIVHQTSMIAASSSRPSSSGDPGGEILARLFWIEGSIGPANQGTSEDHFSRSRREGAQHSF